MTKEEIGLFVLKERKKQKLSQKGLAEKAGLTRYQQIMEIEAAIVNYGIDVLIKVLTALNYKISKEPIDKEIAIIFNEMGEELFLIDFSKVESIKPEPDEKIIGKLKKKPVYLQFKR